jgi:hypothetical protein
MTSLVVIVWSWSVTPLMTVRTSLNVTERHSSNPDEVRGLLVRATPRATRQTPPPTAKLLPQNRCGEGRFEILCPDVAPACAPMPRPTRPIGLSRPPFRYAAMERTGGQSVGFSHPQSTNRAVRTAWPPARPVHTIEGSHVAVRFSQNVDGQAWTAATQSTWARPGRAALAS